MSLDDIMTSILKKLLQKRLLTMRTSEIFFQKLININFELTCFGHMGGLHMD